MSRLDRQADAFAARCLERCACGAWAHDLPHGGLIYRLPGREARDRRPIPLCPGCSRLRRKMPWATR